MRLFLSSYRAGDHVEALMVMIGEETKIAVITNAKDDKTTDERANSVNDLKGYLKEQGLEPHEIDLRRYFDEPEALQAELEKYAVVWVAGGNTFVLHRALKQSGGDDILKDLVADDKLIYIGESAGAIMATPGLTGAEFEDDPYVVPEEYDDDEDDSELWTGLGLVEYYIVPHYESGLEGIDRMVDVLEEEGLPYRPLANNQAIAVMSAQEDFLA